MQSATSPEQHDLAQPTRLWQAISDCLEGFIEAWDRDKKAPSIAQFANHQDPPLRRLALVELIKVDMEYRSQQGPLTKLVEHYVEEFPEIASDGVPLDLLYEEYHLRKRSGEAVELNEYCRRFPQQSDELRRMLDAETPQVTTVLFGGESAAAVEVNDQIDDFDILARLGKGAFATVFLARQRSMQRIVALKVSADRGKEAQTLAQLDHPHIVRVYDQRILPDRGLRLLYMQYVAGGTLQPVVEAVRRCPPVERTGQLLLREIDRALDDRGQSPPTDSTIRRRLAQSGWGEVVCWIGARLAGALDYAHGQGVLHRDIKPANVLVGADGTPKLVDFNIACCSKVEGASPLAYFGGSLAYMSPEQLEACNPSHERRPDELDARAEVYSLGVMLWELVCGRRPFAEEQVQTSWPKLLSQMARQRRDHLDAATIAALPANLPSGLREILLRCLEADPARRFPSAGELARQLELCLRPSAQRLLLPGRQSWRIWARRHPTIALATVAIIPNAAISLVNIGYNVRTLIGSLPEATQKFFWDVMMPTVNGVLYSAALALCIALCWPVLRAVRSEQPAPPAIRRKSLRLPEYIFWVVLAAWSSSGILFPTWLGRAIDHPLGSAFRYHFIASQLLFGLLAGTLAYFGDALVAVRSLHGALLANSTTDERDIQWLGQLGARVWRFFGVSVAVPFLSIAVLAGAAPAQQLAFVVIGLVGFVGFMISFALARAIQSDIAALASALAPTGESLPGESRNFDGLTGSTRV